MAGERRRTVQETIAAALSLLAAAVAPIPITVVLAFWKSRQMGTS